MGPEARLRSPREALRRLLHSDLLDVTVLGDTLVWVLPFFWGEFFMYYSSRVVPVGESVLLERKCFLEESVMAEVKQFSVPMSKEDVVLCVAGLKAYMAKLERRVAKDVGVVPGAAKAASDLCEASRSLALRLSALDR